MSEQCNCLSKMQVRLREVGNQKNSQHPIFFLASGTSYSTIIVAYFENNNDICRNNKRQNTMSKVDILNESEVLYAARSGVTRTKMNDIMNITGITLTEMGQYVHVTPRTFQRKKPNEKLPSDISEKILLIQNLYIKGSNVLGNLEAFKSWMCTANVAFNGATPKSFLDTFSGIELLLNELGRIEHGFVA